MDKDYSKRQKWFTDRVGIVIYRNKVSCNCKVCTNSENNGILITDETHAMYLTDISFELRINYRDESK